MIANNKVSATRFVKFYRDADKRADAQPTELFGNSVIPLRKDNLLISFVICFRLGVKLSPIYEDSTVQYMI